MIYAVSVMALTAVLDVTVCHSLEPCLTSAMSVVATTTPAPLAVTVCLSLVCVLTTVVSVVAKMKDVNRNLDVVVALLAEAVTNWWALTKCNTVLGAPPPRRVIMSSTCSRFVAPPTLRVQSKRWLSSNWITLNQTLTKEMTMLS